MKILLSILLLSIPLFPFWFVQPSTAPYAPPPNKKIIQVGCGEYQTTYLHSDGTVHAWLYSSNYFYGDFGLTGVIEDIGAQYDNIVLLNDGTTRRIRKANDGSASVITIPIDTFGRAFNFVQHVYGFWQSYLFIAHDSVYYLGLGNNLTYGSLGLGGGAILTKPMPIGQPAGRKVVKLVTLEQAAGGMDPILELCDDGTVWTVPYGSTTPVQKSGLSGITDIAAITRACYVAISPTDIKVWGPFSAYFSGLSDGVTTPTSVLSSFTSVGLQMPLKQSISNYNTIHFIDNKNDLYGEGDNIMGEVGNGVQINPWRTYKNGTSSAPFAWDFARGQLMQSPIQIPGKWYQVFGGSNIAFFFFGQDIGAATGLDSNWYAWGRNKEDALGNGIRAGNDGTYNCWGAIPAPAYVSPANVGHLADFTFVTSNTFDPLGNAGIDQYVSTTTATINGSGSSQPEGSITTYAWTPVGGTASVTSPSSSVTGVTGLSAGVNKFRLLVTNNSSVTDADTISVFVTFPYISIPSGSKVMAH